MNILWNFVSSLLPLHTEKQWDKYPNWLMDEWQHLKWIIWLWELRDTCIRGMHDTSLTAEKYSGSIKMIVVTDSGRWRSQGQADIQDSSSVASAAETQNSRILCQWCNSCWMSLDSNWWIQSLFDQFSRICCTFVILRVTQKCVAGRAGNFPCQVWCFRQH